MLAFHKYFMFHFDLLSPVSEASILGEIVVMVVYLWVWCPVTFDIQPFTQKYTDQQIALTPIILDYINL